MRLSYALLLEVCAAVGPAPAPAPPSAADERRGVPRLPVGRGATLVLPHGDGRGGGGLRGGAEAVVVRDVSVTGIGLLCGVPVAAGKAFVVALPGLCGRAVAVRYRAARCDALGGEGAEADAAEVGGARFAVEATFLGLADPALAAENRRAVEWEEHEAGRIRAAIFGEDSGAGSPPPPGNPGRAR